MNERMNWRMELKIANKDLERTDEYLASARNSLELACEAFAKNVEIWESALAKVKQILAPEGVTYLSAWKRQKSASF